MRHIYLNLKRFDIPQEFGGVNSIAPFAEWGPYIIKNTEDTLASFYGAEFTMFFPEAHIISAAKARKNADVIHMGCQGVLGQDTALHGNFGAFTTGRTANSMVAAGCDSVIIGHCEERREKAGLLKACEDKQMVFRAVNGALNEEVRAAQKAGLKVLYCIGETEEEQSNWRDVLGWQLDMGLEKADKGSVVIAYEPVWSIGPGKRPADSPYITKVARFIKEKTGGMDVVYGGGLKADNAAMLAAIEEIDGGLIALTRFSGAIGFYPDEYLEIIRLYLGD